MDRSYNQYADGIIQQLSLKHKSGKEYGDAPCPNPNCGGGTDRFFINEYNGKLYHHCRQSCDFKERDQALQDRGLLPKWQASSRVPYHMHKGLPLLGGARLDNSNLVIPIHHVQTGEQVGTQIITPDGKKRFSKGMKKSGAGAFIGERTSTLYVVEGWATGVAVYLATEQQVLFALDADTLVKTAKQLDHPNIVVAADNDEAGIKAAKATGKPWAAPEAAEEDWWDVFNRLGKGGVADGLRQAKRATSKNDDGDDKLIKWHRLSDFAGKPVKARDWTVEGWIPRGQVSLLYADGGVGKSQITLQLLTNVALGQKWFGLNTAKGPTLYVGAEDDLEELHRRFDAVIDAGFETYENFEDVVFTSLAGQDALLAHFDPKAKLLSPSLLMQELEAAFERHAPVLCVIDTLADVYPADENDRALARQFIGMLRKVAIEYNCAIVVLAHPSLSGMTSNRNTSGSTGWNNSVRSRITMKRDDENNPDRRTLELAKSNYGRVGAEIHLMWENGVFVHDPQSSGLDAKAAHSKACRVFLNLLEEVNENGGKVNANGGNTYAPTVFAAHTGNEGVTRRGFTTAMKSLLAKGVILSEKHERSSRLVVATR